MTECNTALPRLTQYQQGQRYIIPCENLLLESGQFLAQYELACEFFGSPNATLSNIVLVEHALTLSSHVTSYLDLPTSYEPGWWDGVVGPGLALDTNKYCVIAINALGSCYGSTGPSSIHSDGLPWGSRFPAITTRDQVAAEHALLQWLGISSLAAVLGGSMGAARVLEWAMMYPQWVRSALVLAISAKSSAYLIGTQQLQIDAITSDPHWYGGNYYTTDQAPLTGLRIARQIAHLTYRSYQELEDRFSNNAQTQQEPLNGGEFAVSSYLRYQGDKLCRRFDAGSYVSLTQSLNTHDVGRNRGGVIAALHSCQVPFVVGGIANDNLFPLHEQRFLSDNLPSASPIRIIDSPCGHDGFLLEKKAIAALVTETLDLA